MAIQTAAETPIFKVPKDYVGPVTVPGTGREVYWTGRVAIGLRHEAPRRIETLGSQEVWVQKLLLG